MTCVSSLVSPHQNFGLKVHGSNRGKYSLNRRPLYRADGMFYGYHEAPFPCGLRCFRSRESPLSIDADLIIARLEGPSILHGNYRRSSPGIRIVHGRATPLTLTSISAYSRQVRTVAVDSCGFFAASSGIIAACV
jgi:hypothetical protein